MLKINSLKYTIGLQFAIIVMPIEAVLVYQSLTDIQDATTTRY
jgi:hypothetical protein